MCGFFGLRSGSGFSWGASLGFRVGLLLLLFSFYCLSFCFVSLDLRLPKLGPPNRPNKQNIQKGGRRNSRDFFFRYFWLRFRVLCSFGAFLFQQNPSEFNDVPRLCFVCMLFLVVKTLRHHDYIKVLLDHFVVSRSDKHIQRIWDLRESMHQNRKTNTPPKKGRKIANLKNIKNDTDYNSSEKR